VVRQPVQELGRLAAELLFERLNNGGSQLPRRNIVLPVDLIVRESCGCGPNPAAID
jgi:LacI family transcriptional regulator